MHWVPPNVSESEFPGIWSSTLLQITQHPRVELDINCDTEAVIKVPYTSPAIATNLHDGTGKNGTVYVSIYSPFATGPAGAQGAEWTLYGHFEDVELEVPTVRSGIIPQSGSGELRGKSPQDAERRQPVTSMAKSLGNIANQVSYMVPSLKPLAGPVEWFSHMMAGAASAVGWSNPADAGPVMRVRPENAPYHNNSNGVTNPYFLALKAGNNVAVMDNIDPSGMDVSSLKGIACRDAFIATVAWNASATPGTFLHAIDHHPFYGTAIMNDTTTTPNYNVYAIHTPLGFVASHFGNWRGSIRITMKFVKTEFHSGRLLVAYAPGNQIADPLPDVDNDTPFLMRDIIDIRESNEYSVTLPYCTTKPYLQTVGNAVWGERAGMFYVYVLNTLVAPDNVAQNIQILFEISAGPDIEFAVPSQAKYPNAGTNNTWLGPYVPSAVTPQMGNALGALKNLVFCQNSSCSIQSNCCDRNLRLLWDDVEYQSGPGPDPTDQCDLVPRQHIIGDATITPDGHSSSVYCVGEKILSVYDLLKRKSVMQFNTTPPQYCLQVDPLWSPWFYHTTTGAISILPHGDEINMWIYLFAFSRGSIRWYYWDSQQTENLAAYVKAQFQLPITSTAPILTDGSAEVWDLSLVSTVTHNDQISGIMEVECPFYSRFPKRLNRQTDNYVSATYEYDYAPRLQIKTTNTTTQPVYARSVGDDFQFGQFVSTVPILLNIQVGSS